MILQFLLQLKMKAVKVMFVGVEMSMSARAWEAGPSQVNPQQGAVAPARMTSSLSDNLNKNILSCDFFKLFLERK